MVARLVGPPVSIDVLTTATDPSLPPRDKVDGVRVRRVYVNLTSAASKLRASWLLFARLVQTLPRVDLVHIHGVSLKNIPVTALAKVFGRPVVLSLHTAGHDEPATVRR